MVMAKTAGVHVLLWQKNVECYPTALILHTVLSSVHAYRKQTHSQTGVK